jgi:hypothetical protein
MPARPLCCDDSFRGRMSLRTVLRVGGLGALGVSLPSLLRAEAEGGPRQIVHPPVSVWWGKSPRFI